MANASIQVRLSPELKQQAEELFAELGLSVSDAVRLFLKQSVNRGGLPFQPQAGQPNAETVAAIRELQSGGGQRFDTVEALAANWKTP